MGICAVASKGQHHWRVRLISLILHFFWHLLVLWSENWNYGVFQVHYDGRTGSYIHSAASQLSNGRHASGLKFFYIVPTEHEEVLRKFYPKEKGPVSNIDPIGNSPVIIKKVSIALSSRDWRFSSVINLQPPCAKNKLVRLWTIFLSGWVYSVVQYTVVVVTSRFSHHINSVTISL